MNNLGYGYRNARKKGQLSKEDMKNRLKWCKEKKKANVTQEFWNRGVSLYMDGTGFVFKENAFDQAKSVKSKVWRRPDEGLERGCTAKLNKAGTVQAKFMVGISYERGVVLCEHYTGLTGKKFSKMMDQCIPRAFDWSINPTDRRYLQDGCPVQNSRIAQEILEDLGAELVSIPARSPDLNPIENFFHLVGQKLEQGAITNNITHQTFDEFVARVTDIILNFDRNIINKIIGNMDTRIQEVIKKKGGRTKY
ncbi:uncharacterized protein [Clytia hemisphaerica]|uniref:uncharacterized protein n=1 Tax=Clytia hemisphaerica TaxID=252671 RepID=UPI0034D6A35D